MNRLTVAVQRGAECTHHADQRNSPVDPYRPERREVVQGRSHLDGLARGECLVDGGRKRRIVDGVVLLDVSRLMRGSDVAIHAATVLLVFCVRIVLYTELFLAVGWGTNGELLTSGTALSSAGSRGHGSGRWRAADAVGSPEPTCLSGTSDPSRFPHLMVPRVPMSQRRIGNHSPTCKREVGPGRASGIPSVRVSLGSGYCVAPFVPRTTREADRHC
jgi:hypothetical protein